jgi:hypothetical protein
MSPQAPVSPTAADLQRLVAGELSPAGRMGHVALLLIALAVVGVIGSLWLTEPGLPQRTQVAFGALTIMGVGWVAFAWWVLTARRPLLAAHRLVAARMAVVFCAVFVAGSLLVSVVTPDVVAGRSAAAFGSVLCLIATVLRRRAGHRVNQLRSRRQQLERAIGR